MSSNQQNTGMGAFLARIRIMKRIIRLFSKAAWYIKPIKKNHTKAIA